MGSVAERNLGSARAFACWRWRLAIANFSFPRTLWRGRRKSEPDWHAREARALLKERVVSPPVWDWYYFARRNAK
jgi:hypothetical protein